MSQICKICYWRPSTILELAGRLLLRSLEQRQIEGWSWWQNWPILCALQLCCWVEDLNSNGLGSRPASMKMYKSRRNGRKSPKNRKLHLKCGGLRWTQWSKILFSPFLYIGMTIEFTWGWPKSWFFSFCSPPYYNGLAGSKLPTVPSLQAKDPMEQALPQCRSKGSKHFQLYWL